jgi:hypothetical protein
MRNEPGIKVAQYFSELTSKQWFGDELHKTKELLKASSNQKET